MTLNSKYKKNFYKSKIKESVNGVTVLNTDTKNTELSFVKLKVSSKHSVHMCKFE